MGVLPTLSKDYDKFGRDAFFNFRLKGEEYCSLPVQMTHALQIIINSLGLMIGSGKVTNQPSRSAVVPL